MKKIEAMSKEYLGPKYTFIPITIQKYLPSHIWILPF